MGNRVKGKDPENRVSFYRKFSNKSNPANTTGINCFMLSHYLSK